MVIDISARIVQASLGLYVPMPSVMHMPSDETEQYDGPKTTVQRDDGDGDGSGDGSGDGGEGGSEGKGGCGSSAMVCALAKPTTMVRKSTPTSRGADPKRPAEPRRAEGRHEGEAALTARRPLGGLGMGARAEAPRAAKAWTAPYSTAQSRPSSAIMQVLPTAPPPPLSPQAQSRPSTASRPGRGAWAVATREAPIVDERVCGKEAGSVSCTAPAMSMVFFALKASVSGSQPR
jgi:hypothetical protein